MEDERILDTAKAVQEWAEKTDFDGQNQIGRITGSQWREQTLYRSSKGRYYVEEKSRVQGEHSFARIVTPKEAAGWLLLNDYELTEDLKEFEKDVVE